MGTLNSHFLPWRDNGTSHSWARAPRVRQLCCTSPLTGKNWNTQPQKEWAHNLWDPNVIG